MNLVTRISSRTRRAVIVAAIGLSALALNAGPASASTSISVYGVCHLSSTYGTVHTATINGYPTAYWLNSAGAPYIVAYSDDGNSSVDAAGVTNSNGEVTWVAFCNQQTWTPVARVEAHPTRYAASAGAVEDESYVAGRIAGLNEIGPDYDSSSDD